VSTRTDKRIQLLLFSFFFKFTFYTPFIALYLKNIYGANSQRILIVFSIYTVSVFLFEIPMGILSDRYGERVSLIASSILLVCSTILMVGGSYFLFIVGEVLFAISQSLYSGSYESIVFKHCSDGSNNLDYEATLGQSTSILWLSISLAALLGYILAKYSIRYVFYATAVSNFFCLALSFRLPQVSKSSEKKNSLTILNETLHYAIRDTKFRSWIFRSALFTSVILSGYFLIQTYLNERGISGPTNGVLYFFITLFAFLSSLLYPKLNSCKFSLNPINTLILLVAIIALTFFLLTIASSFYFVLILACLFRLVWGFSTPYFTSILNRSIRSDSIRNSSLSLVSLLTSLLTSILMAVLSKFSSNFGYIILLTLLTVLIITLLISLRRHNTTTYENRG